MLRFLILLILLLQGCSPSKEKNLTSSYPAYESPAESLIQEYESIFKISVEYPVYVENSRTGIQPGGYKILGLCVIDGNGQKSVYLNETWWNDRSENDRRVLLYHELTHCSFYRGHDDRKYSSGMPYSIMSSVINPVLRYYAQYNRYYLNEVVNPDASHQVPSSTSTFITTEDNCLFKE